MKTDWKDLSATSHYLTAVKIKDALNDGAIDEAYHGITELVESMSRADKRAAKSLLVVLMKHVIKWKSQPQKRSVSWMVTIRNARREIAALREDTPSITQAVLESYWAQAFEWAKDDAEQEMGEPSSVQSLSWNEVFVDDYSMIS
ncbi:MAG: DUF29 domain-containing protein [Chloroherpetonaceae bacterium]